MRDPNDPAFFPNDTGPTLAPAQFIDTSGFGVVPFRVFVPGPGELAPAAAPAPEPLHGEPVEPTFATLRATLDAIDAETAWRGPPRDMPLNDRAAGSRLVKKLNTAIAEIAVLLAAEPPPAREAIRLTTVPTGMMVALADLRGPVRQARRALGWLAERESWRRRSGA